MTISKASNCRQLRQSGGQERSKKPIATAISTESHEPVVALIASDVLDAPIKHLDETGFRIGGKTNWLHVVSTPTMSWYRVAQRRKDIELLADIKGVVVHDHWNPYYQLTSVNHALCNAHHLRELKALEEIEQESWAKSMKRFLLLSCNYKNRFAVTFSKLSG